MSIQIKLKNSVVQDSIPSTSDLPAVGEIALNANINSIGGFMRASNNTIVKIFGPGSLSTPTATTTVSGISELATNSETTTGTATNRVVTPAGLNAVTVAERTTSNTNYVAKAGSTLTGVLTMPNGSNSAPAINFGDSDSGIFGGTNTVSLAAGGTTRLTADTGVSVVGTLAVTGAITSTSNLTIADKIIHAGDTDTAIRFAAANTISVENAGTESARFDSAGRLLIGTSTFIRVGASSLPKVQVCGTSENAAITLSRYTADNSPSRLSLGKSRGATVGTMTVVQDDDGLGEIVFCGADGTDLHSKAASIVGEVDGTPGANDLPGRLIFRTTADGAAGPTTRMTIKADGDIGIGTTSPANTLHVHGDGILRISPSAGANQFESGRIRFTENTSDFQGAYVHYDGSSNIFHIGTHAANDTVAGNDLNSISIPRSSGNVGIGTNSPSEKLEVSGDIQVTSGSIKITGTTPGIRFTDSDASGGFGHVGVNNTSGSLVMRSDDGNALNNSYMGFEVDSSERMRIDSSGKVGIGTSSPDELLHVANTSGGASILIETNNSSGGNLLFGDNASNTVGRVQYVHSDDSMRVFTASTERLRIDSSGKIGINESSPLAKFHVKVADSGASAYAHCAAVFEDSDHTFIDIMSGTTGSGGINFGDSGGSQRGVVEYDHNSDFMRLIVAGGERMRVGTSGNVYIGQTSGSEQLGVSSGTNSQTFSTNSTNSNGNMVQIKCSGTTNLFLGSAGSFITGQSGLTNQGIRAEGALLFATGGHTERMRIDSSGNVGINQTSPTCPLQVDAGSSGSGTSTALELNHKGNDLNDAIKLNFARAGGDIGSIVLEKVNNNNTTDFIFNTRVSNTVSESMRITGAGTIKLNQADSLIHTNSNSSRLRLFGGSDATVSNGAALTLHGVSHSSGNYADLAAGTGGHIQFRTGTSERMRIDTIGKLLLGITASNDTSEMLLVASAGTGDHCGMGIKTNNNVHDGYYAFHDSDASFRGSVRYDHSVDAMFFTTNGVNERMRIDSSGHLLVGTTSLDPGLTNTFGVHIDPHGYIAASHNGATAAYFNRSSTTGVVVSYRYNGTQRGSISTDGTVIAVTGTSDYRLKENNVIISDGITRLKQLKPYRFNFKETPSKTIDGFFAHEVNSVVPEAVFGEKDAVATEADTQSGYTLGEIKPQQLDQSKLVPLLVAAVQELIGKVEKLEAA